MSATPRLAVVAEGMVKHRAGGMNRFVESYADAMNAAGAEASLSLAANDTPGGRAFAAPLPLRLARSCWRTLRRARDADIIDIHFSLYGFLPLLLGVGRRREVVVHFHGPWAAEGAFQQEGSATVSLKRAIERFVYRRADRLFVLSQPYRGVLVETYGVDASRVTVVPPGVDLERFAPGDRREARVRLGLPSTGRIVTTVRRLVPRMGIDVLLHAWSSMQRARDDLLVVVGDGQDRADLVALARQLGVEGSVRFVGKVDDDQLVRHLQAADLFVVPTVALEGFGLVVLEALACGTPVVVTDVGGLGSAVTGLSGAAVVPADDIDALAAALAAHPDSFPTAERCRAQAERFSWATCATRTLDALTARTRPAAPRVACITHTAALSGGELALLRLVRQLRDVDVTLILGEDGPLATRFRDAGAAVRVLPLPTSVRRVDRPSIGLSWSTLAVAVATAICTARLVLELRRLRPSIVHTNSLKANLYGGIAGRLAGRPVVWHVRDILDDGHMPPHVARFVRQAATLLPTEIICNSAATARSLGPVRRPVTVVPSPTDIQPRRRPMSSGVLRIGMVGRLAPWKGQDVFVRALAKVATERDVLGVIVGAPLFGEHDYAAALERLVDELGLHRRVRLDGFREDIGVVLSEFDILVHASVLAEPFGQVIVEGMAAGLPVVATAAGGPLEVVDDGVTGILVAPGDVDSLAAALTRLVDDSELRRSLGDAAQKAAERYSPESVAAAVRRVYRSAQGVTA